MVQERSGVEVRIDRCRREIAVIEQQLRAGDPDIDGLLLALTDWSAELRILLRSPAGSIGVEMRAIVRRVAKLETLHQQRHLWSWSEEYEAIQEATLRKMSTSDLMLLEPTLASLGQGRRGDLTRDGATNEQNVFASAVAGA